MGYKFGERSMERLKGVHPKLIEVAELALSRSLIDYTIGPYGGKRNLETQKMLKDRGSSRTLKSRHLDGCAIDMVTWRRLPATGKYGYDWSRWSDYAYIAKLMKQAAIELNIPIEWGGDWKSFKDGPHFQLPRSYCEVYNDNKI